MFIVVCDICGYKSAKASLIEFAGEELIQHMQIVGCKDNTFLEEVDSSSPFNSKAIRLKQEGPHVVAQTDNAGSESVVEQLAKLASLKEGGALSEEEFVFIKKEILKRLK